MKCMKYVQHSKHALSASTSTLPASVNAPCLPCAMGGYATPLYVRADMSSSVYSSTAVIRPGVT